MELKPRKIEKIWCHEYEVYECGWIDGLELEPPEPKCCHNAVHEDDPLCSVHKESIPDAVVVPPYN